MGADDDADCPGHVWVTDQLHLTLDSADVAEHCARCSAVRYRTDQEARARRRLLS